MCMCICALICVSSWGSAWGLKRSQSEGDPPWPLELSWLELLSIILRMHNQPLCQQDAWDLQAPEIGFGSEVGSKEAMREWLFQNRQGDPTS